MGRHKWLILLVLAVIVYIGVSVLRDANNALERGEARRAAIEQSIDR